jgi:hypothetical protein
MTNGQSSASRFLLLDGRAKFGNAEGASVMDTASSEAEAAESGWTVWKGSDGIWEEVEYKNGELCPIRLMWDLPPARRAK